MGSTTSNLLKAAKLLRLILLALGLLVAGVIGTDALWQAVYSRYDAPNTGYYHGFVSASFSGKDDDVFIFNFRGRSEPAWYWQSPTNFAYSSLHYEWRSFRAEDQASEGSGTLLLPAFAYESTNGSGTLTRSMLASWLLGTTNSTAKGRRSVDAVFDSLEAAGKGTLPSPRHHGIEVALGRIQHFQLGAGVSGILVVWVVVWLLSVIFYGRRWLKRNESPAVI